MTTLADAFKQIEPKVIQGIIEQVQRELPSGYEGTINDARRSSPAALATFTKDLEESTPRYFYEYFSKEGYTRAQQDIPLDAAIQALRVINQQIMAGFKSFFANDLPMLIEALELSYAITGSGVLGFYAGYERARSEVIENQQSALQELSTPIIPIYEGILVLPLVGSIDSQRAGQIMETLLEGINSSTADVVIIDITGVPVIDTGVANYIVQAARAARLLGSKVVLVGIGAEIAQTIVQLGIDLTGIITRSNLQTGIEYALGTRGLAIGPEAYRARGGRI